ncbi:MAG: hypothetical protein FJ387_24480 [Verrucomicrobia bacterium]|nr:hypothetical protein [Verrucomicrobiota bacterium]
MIENNEQMEQAYEALGDLYRMLASYRAKVLPVSARNYTLIAQGPLEEVRKLQAEIDVYLGLQGPGVMASEQTGAWRETPPPFGRKSEG